MRRILIVACVGVMLVGFAMLAPVGAPVTSCVASGPDGPGVSLCGRSVGRIGLSFVAVGALLLIVVLQAFTRER